MEASGTSGMKASLNGVPHLSIGDGWWAEGYTGENGWLIDAGDAGDDADAQDAADAAALYDLLETRDRAELLRSRRTAFRGGGSTSCARRSHRRAALQRAADGQGIRGHAVRAGHARAGRGER